MNIESQDTRLVLAEHMEAVAQELLGNPNPRESTLKEWRYGNRGSLSIDLEKGTFFDNEKGEGGGVLALIQRELGLAKADAANWLKERTGQKPPAPKASSKIVATYRYDDENGGHLFDVVRFEPKDFRQRAPDGAWKVKDIRKVLYHLPKIKAAQDGATIFLVEGEKDVLALEALGLLATTNPGGAGKWRDEYNDALKGKSVVILPDNDQAGRDHAATVQASLAKANIDCTSVDLEGLPPKGDVADWLAKGGTVDNLRELVKAAKAKPKSEATTVTDLTEDGVALSFTKRHGGKMRFDHDQGRWFEWQGDRWKPDNTHLAYSYCRQIARELSQDLKEGQRAPFRKAAFAAGVERMARADRAHAVTSDGWDNDPFLLGCPGVTVDLRTGAHMSPSPEHGITKQAAVRPAAGDCPLWRSFLLEVCEGDEEMVRFLHQWAGYCLTGDTREHALLFVYGPGGNGKSVFLETVTHILGEYAATASMDTFTASKQSQHLTFMAMLRGARLVTASETEEGKAWAETKIKQVTGGDRITANFMRQDAFTFTPQFKLTVVGNHKPILRSVDDAARRRFNIVPFTVKPKNPDRELTAKLRAEAPAILQWMIQGCLDWQANGLMRPRRVLDATAEYFDDQDLFGQWLDEACRIEPDNRSLAETPKALFENWKNYAMSAGENPGTQAALLSVLAKRGLMRDKRKIAGKQERIWRGIELHHVQTYQP